MHRPRVIDCVHPWVNFLKLKLKLKLKLTFKVKDGFNCLACVQLSLYTAVARTALEEQLRCLALLGQGEHLSADLDKARREPFKTEKITRVHLYIPSTSSCMVPSISRALSVFYFSFASPRDGSLEQRYPRAYDYFKTHMRCVQMSRRWVSNRTCITRSREIVL